MATANTRMKTKLTAQAVAAQAAMKTNGAAHAAASQSEDQRIRAARIDAASALYDEQIPQNAPSAFRCIVAMLAHFAAFCSGLYWGLQAAGFLGVIALMFTGSAFITFCVIFLTALISMRFAWKTGKYIADFILDFDSKNVEDTGRELREAAARKVSVMRGWFSRKKEVVEDNDDELAFA